ncbi:MAG: tRNA (5-methylaminomethyl-2-thiouridine)(34)-methyltransferase MnmD [Candidatus Omnitrophica bacterium]|nr:tRNA (5-methylaminomethyl-2-thiouridine)(34)-methyltransferase MnmD [Candidatus Omnitrophota bacterium]
MRTSEFTNEPVITWDDNGAPRSVRFDDKYFCQENGYDEAIYVCCNLNALEARFKALPVESPGTFTIVETGFGTGLDFCCARQVWEANAPPSWIMHFISLERYPLSAEQLGRALGHWTQLAQFANELAAAYIPKATGSQDLFFKDGHVHLTIIFDDVIAALEKILQDRLAGAGADALFLDGFAPSKNPAMWTPEVFRLLAALSRPGTTLSTFTVAGFVRRGLEAQGFSLIKKPGHGKKSELLTGIFSDRKS